MSTKDNEYQFPEGFGDDEATVILKAVMKNDGSALMLGIDKAVAEDSNARMLLCNALSELINVLSPMQQIAPPSLPKLSIVPNNKDGKTVH
ncbi:MAG: hypothetical protein DRH06_00295 [Deltaproteobacteria bacterium]|nr:MAG: hypothetical protein DRH06_00295 [Deltaproteobacteria bacterium]